MGLKLALDTDNPRRYMVATLTRGRAEMTRESYDVRPTEHRKRLLYIGKPRNARKIERTYEPNAKGLLRRIDRSAPVGGRYFAAPGDAIIWDRAKQTEAVDRGFFIERDRTDNHARVLPRGRETDADIMRELVAQARTGDGFATLTIQFIAQQDQYGYSGTWEKSIERWSPHLLWYKRLKAEEQANERALRNKMANNANKRWANQSQVISNHT